jgi:hypothetical protein
MSLLLLGCTVIIYKKNPSNKYDCEILTTIFIDSLREDNIDTILYFSNKCCGCGKGTGNTNYIFWKKNNDTKVLKISSYSGKQKIKQFRDIFLFYNIDSVKNEKLNNPKFELSHYGYYRLIYFSKHGFESNVPEYYLEVNNDKYITNLIYRIERILYKLQI